MHGQPVWSYLYRYVIPHLTNAGMRVIAPTWWDTASQISLPPAKITVIQRQVEWMGDWLETNDFSDITFFGQDWGGLIGLRLVVNHPDRFSRVVISNTGLPYNPDVPKEVVQSVEDFRANAATPNLIEMRRAISGMRSGAHPATKFAYWQKWCWETEDLPVGFMMSMTLEPPASSVQLVKFLLNRLGVTLPMPTSIARGLRGAVSDPSFKMGPRAMPSQVPTLPTSPWLEDQRQAWEFFKTFEKPFLCAFADNDPVTQGGDKEFLAKVPGTQGLSHTTIKGGGHFVQENARSGAQVIIDLIRST